MIKDKGFTIIELMIVVVIIAILTAVAYPSYRQHVLTSNRLEAKASLLELSQLQENFYVENNRYATTLVGLNAQQAGFAKEGETFVSKNPKLDIYNGHYELSLTGTNDTYTITAKAVRSQTEDTSCIIFTIDQAGDKIANDNAEQPSDKCW
ncbi:type IV pilin protein [Thiotrichales bacterium HSG1]|nr:type IV pilin protein [Thiotrichales bacterium HSG1]